MSLYRFVRLTATLALLKRYRLRLVRAVFALSFALVTAWLYDDVATFLQAQAPQWAATALLIKTLIVYLAFFWCFWELSRMLSGSDGQPVSKTSAPAPKSATPTAPKPGPSPLDALADKPKLRSRREDLLQQQDR